MGVYGHFLEKGLFHRLFGQKAQKRPFSTFFRVFDGFFVNSINYNKKDTTTVPLWVQIGDLGSLFKALAMETQRVEIGGKKEF